MRCLGIRVSDFRNIVSADVRFCEGVNVLYGQNAEGKTNLLEAIYLAAIGKSFRGQTNSEVIRFGEEFSTVSLDYFGAGREQNITVRLHRGKTRVIERNRVPVTKMSELFGQFRAVLFSPEHLSLIKDGPSERRNFLDIAISGGEPLYLHALTRYNRVLKQRNTLLKQAEDDRRVFDETADVWSRALAADGALIAAYRMKYLKKAAVYVKECFAEMMGGREEPELVYMGPAKEDLALYEDKDVLETLLYRKLCDNHDREIGAGATLWGIHKDDIDVRLNGHSARGFCSQGQQRSLALALKLAEGELCREEIGEYPVFLFDDVLSELDPGRREYLLRRMKEKQVIMTTCEEAVAPEGKRILVQNGNYR